MDNISTGILVVTLIVAGYVLVYQPEVGVQMNLALSDFLAGVAWSLLFFELLKTVSWILVLILIPLFVISWSGDPFITALWQSCTMQKKTIMDDEFGTIIYIRICEWMAKMIYELSLVAVVLQPLMLYTLITTVYHYLLQTIAISVMGEKKYQVVMTADDDD